MLQRFLPFVLALLAWAWSDAAFAKLRVVATIPDLAAVAREVGGDDAQVSALSLPTQDPHWVDARPNLALELSKADMLVAAGLSLEGGWLPGLQTGSRNSRIQTGGAGYLDASTLVRLLQVPTGVVDRSQGDIHPGGNPHYYYDPRAMVAVASGIAEKMAALDPPNAADYRARAQAFKAAIEAALPGWERRLAGLRGRPVLGYHRSWPYLADWLGFEVVMEIEPKPGVPPNPRHLAEVLSTAGQRGIRLILIEEYFQNAAVEQISSRAEATVAGLPGGARFAEGESYLQRTERLVSLLEKSL